MTHLQRKGQQKAACGRHDVAMTRDLAEVTCVQCLQSTEATHTIGPVLRETVRAKQL